MYESYLKNLPNSLNIHVACGHLRLPSFPEFCMLKDNLGPRYDMLYTTGKISFCMLPDGRGYRAHAAI
jgi:hypothetical protein